MEGVPNSLLVRVAVRLVWGEDRELVRTATGCVVMRAFDSHQWMQEIEGAEDTAGWAVYWWHPHSHAVGLLYVLGPNGLTISEPFEAVWRCVDPPPHELIRRVARAWLDYRSGE